MSFVLKEAWLTSEALDPVVATAVVRGPPGATPTPDRILGGDMYADPGGAPSVALRKKISQDYKNSHISY